MVNIMLSLNRPLCLFLAQIWTYRQLFRPFARIQHPGQVVVARVHNAGRHGRVLLGIDHVFVLIAALDEVGVDDRGLLHGVAFVRGRREMTGVLGRGHHLVVLLEVLG